MDLGPLPPPPSRPSSSIRTALIILGVVGIGLVLAVASVFAISAKLDGQGRERQEAVEPPTPADAPAALTIRWTEGDVRTYEILVAHELDYTFDTGESYGGLHRNDAVFELDPVEIRPNGSVDVEMIVPPVRLSPGVNELPFGVGRPQPVRFRQDMSQDRVLELSAEADGQSSVIGLLWPPLPPAPVRPGQTWALRTRLSNAQGSGGVSYEGLCRFMGYEDLRGRDTARVTCRADAEIDLVYEADLVAASAGLPVEETAREGTFTITGIGHLWLYAWIDPIQGLVVQADSQLEVDLKTRRQGFETPWYTYATTEGTMQHRIQLVEQPTESPPA
jgi:hypothetical protein